ncbi:DUF2029 domain-containing protein [Postechiella marina]|uniref:DUF2029 domain-containing protein n=1 Tax=Postechiella marina TaxID=943941 RepID=A0ABP8CFI0_9FLAO
MLLNPNFIKLNKLPLLFVAASILFYYIFAYHLVRTDYIKLLTLYTALFTLFYKLVQTTKHNFKSLVMVAFLFRAIFILAVPNLSQDFYRFIWDGRILLQGINPYLNTVESFITSGEFPVAQAQELYTGMGTLNGSHFTNYPPVNQLCFAIAGLLTGKSILGTVMVFRIIIILADFGTLFFGKKLLEKLNIPVYNIFWYILNPFIIIELTGNLHFEGVMIFFLIWSLYLLHIGKWQFAAVVLALSISVKLIPLIFLPLFFQFFVKRKTLNSENTLPTSIKTNLRTNLKKLTFFYAIVGITTVILFAPFFSSQFVSNYSKTVSLWFQNFEFNASFYYIAREIGYLFRGWNEIAIIGKTTPIIVVLVLLIMTFFRKNRTTVELITVMLLGLSFYYFTATTVHPWYIATLLILSVFTKYKFPLVWSFVIILSYLAYVNINKADKSENLWVIAIEYLVVYGVFLWEIFIKKAPKLEA